MQKNERILKFFELFFKQQTYVTDLSKDVSLRCILHHSFYLLKIRDNVCIVHSQHRKQLSLKGQNRCPYASQNNVHITWLKKKQQITKYILI